MPANPKREVDNREAWEKVKAMSEEIAYGQLTLKFQDYKIILIEKRETELIK